jgi:CMP-N-acetylneuraminic acid synthetase
MPTQRAIDVAYEVRCDPIVITTDDSIALDRIGRTVFEPFRLLYAPAPLHADTCSMVDVVLDVLKRVPGAPDQKVLLLQPTQPLRRSKHLEQALAMLDKCSSLASVVEVEPADKLYWEFFCPVVDSGGIERRQDALPTYACDGTVYGFRREWFEQYKNFRDVTTRMLVIPPEETARLDTHFDWEMAELRLDAERRLRERAEPGNTYVRYTTKKPTGESE